MTLLETRLGQTERRIEREMTQIHGKMDDVFRSIPDKSYVFLFLLTTPVQLVDILFHFLITEKEKKNSLIYFKWLPALKH
jgi:hypothetical protein